MRDSYERFFSKGYLSKSQFFDFGLEETIYTPSERAKQEWEALKQRIQSNGKVFIRGFGRDPGGPQLYLDFYKMLVGNSNVSIDRKNNAKPTRIIQAWTGWSKTSSAKQECLRNYQVSHIFGRTKNVYAFTAPWNIVYTPKMLDPFTGHEAKGEMVAEYTVLFQQQGYQRFESLIEDFNAIVSDVEFVKRLHFAWKLADRILAKLSRSLRSSCLKNLHQFISAHRRNRVVCNRQPCPPLLANVSPDGCARSCGW